MKKIGIVGFGTMGSGIAQVCIEAGYEVVAVEQEEQYFARGKKQMERNWSRAIEKDRLTEEQKDAYEALFTASTDWDLLKDTYCVIEAVSEDMELKKELFKKIDNIVNDETVIVSNTSGLSITELASVLRRPEKAMGFHFFNPVPVMKLVELIRGIETSEETYLFSKELVESLGKESIDVKESPLFAVNRILVPMINEAIFVVQEGVASAEDIDRGFQLGERSLSTRTARIPS